MDKTKQINEVIDIMKQQFSEEEMNKLNHQLERCLNKSKNVVLWSEVVCWLIGIIDVLILIYVFYNFFK